MQLDLKVQKEIQEHKGYRVLLVQKEILETKVHRALKAIPVQEVQPDYKVLKV